MANVGPNFWYYNAGNGTTTGYYGVTAWAASTAVSAGAVRRQLATPSYGNERVFVCIVGGTTGSSEPTWIITKGAKTTDNTVTWQECTGQPGVCGDTTNSPTWTQNKNTAVTIGLIIYDSVSGSLQIVGTAGTTGNGSQPTFAATAGTTTTDNTVTWISLGAASNFSAWGAPHARLNNALATNWAAAGNTVFVGDNSAESQSGSSNIAIVGAGTLLAPISLYCVDHTASVPPGSSNLKTSATVTQATSAQSLTITGYLYSYGISFIYAGSSSSNFTFGGSSQRFDSCTFELSGTTASEGFVEGSTAGSSDTIELVNTQFSFAGTGQYFKISGGNFRWRDTATPFPVNQPAVAFTVGTGVATIVLDGIDLSAMTTAPITATAGAQIITIQNCKLPSGVSVVSSSITSGGLIDIVFSDSSATNYQQQRYTYQGTLTVSTSIVRTNGASNGSTSLAQSIVTTTYASWTFPFESQPIGVWNTLTGATRTITLYGLFNGSALPNNDQIWYDVRYMGSSSSPIASLASGTKANGLASGSAWTADTSAWDSLVSARLNSHAYTVGQYMTVGSGQVFFCTSAGTSAASLPSAYASATDGASVTDGTATFRAGVRFSMSVALSSPQPQIAGELVCIVKAALASSSFWIDPLIVQS